jgi:hypothetical protein
VISLAGAAAAKIASRALHADDRPLLIETHRAAGLKCTQCDQEPSPKLPKFF